MIKITLKIVDNWSGVIWSLNENLTNKEHTISDIIYNVTCISDTIFFCALIPMIYPQDQLLNHWDVKVKSSTYLAHNCDF